VTEDGTLLRSLQLVPSCEPDLPTLGEWLNLDPFHDRRFLLSSRPPFRSCTVLEFEHAVAGCLSINVNDNHPQVVMLASCGVLIGHHWILSKSRKYLAGLSPDERVDAARDVR